MNAAAPDPAARRATLVVFLLACLVYGWGMGSFALVARGEPRYATAARAMLQTGDFVTPRLNGMVYLDKPPLFHWLNAASMAVLGQTPFAFRLPTMLCAALCTALVYGIARRLSGPRAATCTALVLGSCLLWFAMARHARFDMPLAATVAGGLWCCWWAAEGGPARRWWYAGAAALLALGMLIKGPNALVLVVVPFLAALALTGRLAALKHVPWAPCILLFLALAAPWYLACERANPGYLRFFFGHENAWRITREAPTRQPWWHTFAFLLAGILPWTLCAPGAVRRAWPHVRTAATAEGRFALLCLLWVAVTVAVYIPPPVKFIQYIVPAIPALALLLGPFIAGDSRGSRGALMATAVLLLIAGGGMALVGAIYLPDVGLPAGLAGVWAASLLLGGGVAFVCGLRGRPEAAVLCIAAAVILPIEIMCPSIGRAAPYVITEQPVIGAAARHATPGETLLCYSHALGRSRYSLFPPSALYYYPYAVVAVGDPVSEYDYPGNEGHVGSRWVPPEREAEALAAAPPKIGLVHAIEWPDLRRRYPRNVRLLEECRPYVIFETVPAGSSP